MHGTRTIWSAAFVAGAVALSAVCGACKSGDHGPKRRERPARLLPERPAAEPTIAAPAVPSAVLQTLSSVHERLLEITPPSTPPQQLEFGAGRLLQAAAGKVVFRDTKQGDPVAEASIGAVRALAHGSDGALFALGESGGTRLERRSKAPRAFPRVTFLPGSALFGDLEDPAYFYVLYPVERQLYRYPFQTEAGAFLAIEALFSLEGCTSALTLLQDGAFVCRTTLGFARQVPRGRRTEFKSAPGLAEPFRLLPAQRLDELFSISRPAEVRQLRLGLGLPELARFQVPAPIYAAAGNGEALAFVTVTKAEGGQPRRWALLVTDIQGKTRFQVDLGASPAGSGEDWLEALVEAKNLAISWFEPLVAVGGAKRVSVWNYAQGQLVFSR